MSESEWPTVICPGCKVKMSVKKVLADGGGTITGKIIYICEICRMETERPYKGARLQERPL